MKKTLIAVVVMTCISVAASAKKLDIPYKMFTLDNGLTVILHQDNSTPLISINLWFHVGSAYEKPGRTGFAHLFEHIMFEGSKNVPEGMFDEWFQSIGASTNGWTTNDQTVYVETFSSSGLELAMFLESDRMGYLLDAMSEASVDGQRDVVKNERRQSYENRPYGMAWETLGETMYPADHPYHWPVIGYMDDLTAAGYEDVVDFFTRYYSPNNASLVIAGDIDIEETKALVTKWYAEVPRGETVEPVDVPMPKLDGEVKILLEDNVQLPRLYMVWATPPFYKDGDAEADVSSAILGGDKNSRLYKALVYEKQIAQDVSVFVDSGLSSQWILIITARAGQSLDEIHAVVDEEIARLQNEAPTKRELTRVLNEIEVSFLESAERLSSRANSLNQYYYYVGDPGYFGSDLERYSKLKPKDIQEFTREYLSKNRVVLSIVPEGKKELAVSGSRLIDKKNQEVQ